MSKEYLYDYGNGNFAHQEVTVLQVFEDEKGNKYIEEGALRVLLGYEKMREYVGYDGFSFITSDTQLLKKQIPDGLKYETDVKPDLSNEYPYDFKIGMYKVTEEELRSLINNFEKMYPFLRVEEEIKHVDSLTDNKETVVDDYSKTGNEKNDIYDLEIEKMMKSQSIKKEDTEEKVLKNDIYDLEIEKMMKSQAIKKDDAYDDEINYTK